MTAHLAILASLGAAILLSPEVLIAGLILASDRRAPRVAAWWFAIGGIIGLAMAMTIGLLLAPAPEPAATAAAAVASKTWTKFGIRAVIAAALLVIGCWRAVSAFREAPIKVAAPPKPKGSGLRGWVSRHFPRVASIFTPDPDMSTSRRALRAALTGFALDGLHPKVFPIAIAAGHQALQIGPGPERVAGFAVFGAISLLPNFVPVILETVHPGASAKAKEACEEFMKRNGRGISAVILLAAAAYVGWNAWGDMPG